MEKESEQAENRLQRQRTQLCSDEGFSLNACLSNLQRTEVSTKQESYKQQSQKHHQQHLHPEQQEQQRHQILQQEQCLNVKQQSLVPRANTKETSGGKKQRAKHHAQNPEETVSRKINSGEGSDQQATSTQPKQLTPAQRAYWQRKLPRGFDYYLGRIASAVIAAQPPNVLGFCSEFVDNLYRERIGELVRLPKRPYLERLHKRKFGWRGDRANSREILGESCSADALLVTEDLSSVNEGRELDPPTIHSDSTNHDSPGSACAGQGGDESAISQQTWFTAEQTSSEQAPVQQTSIRKSLNRDRKPACLERKLSWDDSLAVLDKSKPNNSSCSFLSVFEAEEVFHDDGGSTGLSRSGFPSAQVQNWAENNSENDSIVCGDDKTSTLHKVNSEHDLGPSGTETTDTTLKNSNEILEMEPKEPMQSFDIESEKTTAEGVHDFDSERDGTGYQISLGTINGMPFQIPLPPKEHETLSIKDIAVSPNKGQRTTGQCPEKNYCSPNCPENMRNTSHGEVSGLNSEKEKKLPFKAEVSDTHSDPKQHKKTVLPHFVKVKQRIEQFQGTEKLYDTQQFSQRGEKNGNLPRKIALDLDAPRHLNHSPQLPVQKHSESTGKIESSQSCARLSVRDALVKIELQNAPGNSELGTEIPGGLKGTDYYTSICAAKYPVDINSGAFGVYGAKTRIARAALLSWWSKAVGGREQRHTSFAVYRRGLGDRRALERKDSRGKVEPGSSRHAIAADNFKGKKEESNPVPTEDTAKRLVDKNWKDNIKEGSYAQCDDREENSNGLEEKWAGAGKEEKSSLCGEYSACSELIKLEERLDTKDDQDHTILESRAESHLPLRQEKPRVETKANAPETNSFLKKTEFPSVNDCKQRLLEKGFHVTNMIGQSEKKNAKSTHNDNSKKVSGLLEKGLHFLEHFTSLREDPRPRLPDQLKNALQQNKSLLPGNSVDTFQPAFSSTFFPQASLEDSLVVGSHDSNEASEEELGASQISSISSESSLAKRNESALEGDKTSSGNKTHPRIRDDSCVMEHGKRHARCVTPARSFEADSEAGELLPESDSVTESGSLPEVSDVLTSEHSGVFEHLDQDNSYIKLRVLEKIAEGESTMASERSEQSLSLPQSQSYSEHSEHKMEMYSVTDKSANKLKIVGDQTSDADKTGTASLKDEVNSETGTALSTTCNNCSHEEDIKTNMKEAVGLARLFVEEIERITNEVDSVLRLQKVAVNPADSDHHVYVKSHGNSSSEKNVEQGVPNCLPENVKFEVNMESNTGEALTSESYNEESKHCGKDVSKPCGHKELARLAENGQDGSSCKAVLSFEGLFSLPQSLLDDVARAIAEVSEMGTAGSIPLVGESREVPLACFRFVGDGVVFKVQPVLMPQGEPSEAATDGAHSQADSMAVSLYEGATEGTSRSAAVGDGGLDHVDLASIPKTRCTNQARRNAAVLRALNGKSVEPGEAVPIPSSLSNDSASNRTERSDTCDDASSNNSGNTARKGVDSASAKVFLKNELDKNSNNKDGGNAELKIEPEEECTFRNRKRQSQQFMKIKHKAYFLYCHKLAARHCLHDCGSHLRRTRLHTSTHKDFSNNSNNNPGNEISRLLEGQKEQSDGVKPRHSAYDARLVAELTTLIKSGESSFKPVTKVSAQSLMSDVLGRGSRPGLGGEIIVPDVLKPVPFCCSNIVCVSNRPEQVMRAPAYRAAGHRKLVDHPTPIRWLSKSGGMLGIAGKSRVWFGQDTEKETEDDKSEASSFNNTSSWSAIKSATKTSETSSTESAENGSRPKKTFKKARNENDDSNILVKGKFHAKHSLSIQEPTLPRWTPQKHHSPTSAHAFLPTRLDSPLASLEMGEDAFRLHKTPSPSLVSIPKNNENTQEKISSPQMLRSEESINLPKSPKSKSEKLRNSPKTLKDSPLASLEMGEDAFRLHKTPSPSLVSIPKNNENTQEKISSPQMLRSEESINLPKSPKSKSEKLRNSPKTLKESPLASLKMGEDTFRLHKTPSRSSVSIPKKNENTQEKISPPQMPRSEESKNLPKSPKSSVVTPPGKYEYVLRVHTPPSISKLHKDTDRKVSIKKVTLSPSSASKSESHGNSPKTLRVKNFQPGTMSPPKGKRSVSATKQRSPGASPSTSDYFTEISPVRTLSREWEFPETRYTIIENRRFSARTIPNADSLPWTLEIKPIEDRPEGEAAESGSFTTLHEEKVQKKSEVETLTNLARVEKGSNDGKVVKGTNIAKEDKETTKTKVGKETTRTKVEKALIATHEEREVIKVKKLVKATEEKQEIKTVEKENVVIKVIHKKKNRLDVVSEANRAKEEKETLQEALANQAKETKEVHRAKEAKKSGGVKEMSELKGEKEIKKTKEDRSKLLKSKGLSIPSPGKFKKAVEKQGDASPSSPKYVGKIYRWDRTQNEEEDKTHQTKKAINENKAGKKRLVDQVKEMGELEEKTEIIKAKEHRQHPLKSKGISIPSPGKFRRTLEKQADASLTSPKYFRKIFRSDRKQDDEPQMPSFPSGQFVHVTNKQSPASSSAITDAGQAAVSKAVPSSPRSQSPSDRHVTLRCVRNHHVMSSKSPNWQSSPKITQKSSPSFLNKNGNKSPTELMKLDKIAKGDRTSFYKRSFSEGKSHLGGFDAISQYDDNTYVDTAIESRHGLRDYSTRSKRSDDTLKATDLGMPVRKASRASTENKVIENDTKTDHSSFSVGHQTDEIAKRRIKIVAGDENEKADDPGKVTDDPCSEETSHRTLIVKNLQIRSSSATDNGVPLGADHGRTETRKQPGNFNTVTMKKSQTGVKTKEREVALSSRKAETRHGGAATAYVESGTGSLANSVDRAPREDGIPPEENITATTGVWTVSEQHSGKITRATAECQNARGKSLTKVEKNPLMRKAELSDDKTSEPQRICDRGGQSERPKSSGTSVLNTVPNSPTKSSLQDNLRERAQNKEENAMMVSRSATKHAARETSPSFAWRAEGLAAERKHNKRRWPLVQSPAKTSKQSPPDSQGDARAPVTRKTGWFDWLNLFGWGARPGDAPESHKSASPVMRRRLKSPRVFEFPLRLHEVPREAKTDEPEVTRVLTLEEPDKNVFVNTTFERPNPRRSMATEEVELRSDTRLLYLTENTAQAILQDTCSPTRRLICEPEAFAEKNSESRQLVLENGSSLTSPSPRHLFPRGLTGLGTTPREDGGTPSGGEGKFFLPAQSKCGWRDLSMRNIGGGEASRKIKGLNSFGGPKFKARDWSDSAAVTRHPRENTLELKHDHGRVEGVAKKKDRFYEEGAKVRKSASSMSMADDELVSEISRSIDDSVTKSREMSPKWHGPPRVRKIGTVVVIGEVEDWAGYIDRPPRRKEKRKRDIGTIDNFPARKGAYTYKPQDRNNSANGLATRSEDFRFQENGGGNSSLLDKVVQICSAVDVPNDATRRYFITEPQKNIVPHEPQKREFSTSNSECPTTAGASKLEGNDTAPGCPYKSLRGLSYTRAFGASGDDLSKSGCGHVTHWSTNTNNSSVNDWREVPAKPQHGRYCEICCCSVCSCESCVRCSLTNQCPCAGGGSGGDHGRKNREKMLETDCGTGGMPNSTAPPGDRIMYSSVKKSFSEVEEEMEPPEFFTNCDSGRITCEEVSTPTKADAACGEYLESVEVEADEEEDDSSLGDIIICKCPENCNGRRVWTCRLVTREERKSPPVEPQGTMRRSQSEVTRERRKSSRVDMILVCKCATDKKEMEKEPKSEKTSRASLGASKQKAGGGKKGKSVSKSVVDPGRSSKSVIDSGRSSKSVVNPGRSSKSVIDSGRSSKSVIDPGRSSKSVIDSGRSSKSVIDPGRSSKSVIDPGRSSKSVIDPGRSSKSVIDPGRSSKSVIDPGRSSKSVIDPSRSSKSVVDPGRSLSHGVQTGSSIMNAVPSEVIHGRSSQLSELSVPESRRQIATTPVTPTNTPKSSKTGSTISWGSISAAVETREKRRSQDKQLPAGDSSTGEAFTQKELLYDIFDPTQYNNYGGTYGIPVDGGGFIDPAYALKGADDEEVFDSLAPLPSAVLARAKPSEDRTSVSASQPSLMDIYDRSQYHVIQQKDSETGTVRNIPVRKESITITNMETVFVDEHDLRSFLPTQRSRRETFRRFKGPSMSSKNLLEQDYFEDLKPDDTLSRVWSQGTFPRRKSRHSSVAPVESKTE